MKISDRLAMMKGLDNTFFENNQRSVMMIDQSRRGTKKDNKKE